MASIGHIAVRLGRKSLSNVQSPLFQLHCSRCSVHHLSYHGNTTPTSPTSHPHSVYGNHTTQYNQFRLMSQDKGFFGQLFDNIKQEFQKNKDMKDNLKKFREDSGVLDKSEALKNARRKFQKVMESEESQGKAEAIKKSYETISAKVKETVDEVGKSELGKKGKDVFEELGHTATKAKETISKSGEQLAKTPLYKNVKEGVKVVRDEIDEATARGRLYQAPKKLQKRDDLRIFKEEHKEFDADTDSTGVQLHKDSQWYQSWQNFKDNNQFINKMFDMKSKYDESEHLVARATRTFTDKMSELFGGVFTKTEMSEVLTEVVKMDPTFDKERFIKDCQTKLIPNILESMVQGELEVLEDWCYEGVYNKIAQPIRQAKEAGYKIDSQVLDISHADIVAGKMMEQGPVLVLSFFAQQVMVVRNASGKVIEGDKEKIMRVFHVWAFCRDQTVLDPIAAWRLIDMSSSPAEQWL